MPTPKRPSARCAEGLSFRLGASLPKDGGDMVSIRSLYGEHPGHGWKGTAGGMGTAGSAYGVVPRGVERFGSFLRRSFACGARLPDRSSPILDSLYGKQPRHQTGLFFSCAAIFCVGALGACCLGRRTNMARAWHRYGAGMESAFWRDGTMQQRYGSGHLRGCCRFRPACCPPEGRFCALGARIG